MSDTGDITGPLRGRLETGRMKPSTPSAKNDGRQPEMPSGPAAAGNEGYGSRKHDPKMTEFEKDNVWYEAFADMVHSFGKTWPDPLTPEEAKACAAHADTIIRRPIDEMWDVENEN